LLTLAIIPRSIDVCTWLDVDERRMFVEKSLQRAVIAGDQACSIGRWITQQIRLTQIVRKFAAVKIVLWRFCKPVGRGTVIRH